MEILTLLFHSIKRYIFFALLLPVVAFANTDSLSVESVRQLLHQEHYQSALVQSQQLLENNDLADSLRWEAKTIEANAYRGLGQIETALPIHQEVLDARKQYFGTSSIWVANSYRNIANCYLQTENLQDALQNFHRANRIFEQNQSTPLEDLLINYQSIGSVYSKLRQRDSANIFLQYAMDRRTQIDTSLQVNLLMGYAKHLLSEWKPKAANNLLHTALALQERQLQLISNKTAKIYTSLAQCNYQTAALDSTRIYLLKADKLLQNPALEVTESSRSNSFFNLAQFYLVLGDVTSAIKGFQQVGSFANWKDKLTKKMSIAKFYAALNDSLKIENAIELNESLVPIAEKNDPTQELKAKLQLAIAECYIKRYDYTNLLGDLDYAIEELQRAFHSFKNLQLPEEQAHCYSFMGDAYRKKEVYSKADTYYRKAKRIFPNNGIIYDFKLARSAKLQARYADALNYLNKIDTSKQLYQSQQLDILAEKAEIAYLQAQAQPTQALWQASLQQHQAACRLLIEQQSQYQALRSGIHLRAEYYAIYDGLIGSCFALGQYDTAYYRLAFRYTQDSKADILAKVLERNSSLPDSIAQQLSQVQQKINQLTILKKLTQASHQENSDSLRQFYRQQQHLQQEVDSLYPLDFFKERHALKQLQKRLTPAQSLIEYHLGTDDIRIFRVNKNNFQQYTIPLDSAFYDDLSRLCTAIRTQRVFGEKAYQIYKRLIAPLDDLQQELIIVPSAALLYLPFEVLLTQQQAYEHEYTRKPLFLIDKHDISYAYSSKLWTTNEQDNTKKHINLLAIAPIFTKDAPPLAHLKHSQAEAKAVRKILGGDVWNSPISRRRFQVHYQDYDILHFATHGIFTNALDNFYLALWSRLPKR